MYNRCVIARIIRALPTVVALVVALLFSLSLAACAAPAAPALARTQTSRPTTTRAIAPSATPRPRATLAPKPRQVNGFRVVYLAELPKEAQRTLVLIARGGPFPYERDGVIFQNRERQLPQKPRGYYHEYTVITPGERDRGARRIITGEAGELYYTADHYASFVRIIIP